LTTWEKLEKDFLQVERIAGRALTRASDVPSDGEISRAAQQLDCTFTDDYIAFLRRYGGATVGSLPIFGLRPVEVTGEPWSVVAATQIFRQEALPGTEDWYVISNDGYGNPIGIARDGRVMIVDHDAGGLSVLADSFEDFLLSHCLPKDGE
jgi:hypothetical protein